MPAPHQIRSARLGDCGWIASRPRVPRDRRVGVDDRLAGDRRAEAIGVLPCQVGIAVSVGGHVVERLVAA